MGILRRLGAAAATVALALTGAIALPAEGASPTTITVPRTTSPNTSMLTGAHGGLFIFGDGSIYDSTGLVDYIPELDGAEIHEFDGRFVAATTKGAGVTELWLIDLDTGDVVSAEESVLVRAVGLAGWAISGTVKGFDGSEAALPPGFQPGAFHRDALVGVNGSTNQVVDAATGALRTSFDVDTAGQGIMSATAAGVSSLSRSVQQCSWAWTGAASTCWPQALSTASRTRVHALTHQVYGEVRESPRRIMDIRVISADGDFPAPAPAGALVPWCVEADGKAYCAAVTSAGRTIYEVTKSGAWVRALDLPQEPFEILDAALTADAVYGVDARAIDAAGAGAWVRRAADKYATEQPIDAYGPVRASGPYAMFDDQWFTRSMPGEVVDWDGGTVLDVSGGYARGDAFVYVPAGGAAWVGATGAPVDTFGDLFAHTNRLTGPRGEAVTANLGSAPVTHLWGEVVATQPSGAPARIRNWRTGANQPLPATAGPVWDLGDGIAVTGADGVIRVFTTTNLGAALPAPVVLEGFPLDVDVNRLLWVDLAGDLKITTFPDAGRSAPMVIGRSAETWASVGYGSVAASPWTASFDTTAPLTAGRIIIRNAAGTVVHSVPTPASADGTISVSWNGRGAGGVALPPGDYTWQLDVADQAGRKAVATRGGAVTGKVYLDNPVVPTAPTFRDLPGKGSDVVVIPAAVLGVAGYTLNGAPVAAGTHPVTPGEVVVVARFNDSRQAPVTWRAVFSGDGPEDIYIVPGRHLVNGRQWNTTCEPYSSTVRCRTDIWATTVAQVGGQFVASNGWVFNNLTYVPSARRLWATNPLGAYGKVGGTAEWVATDGRNWRTECDTALTGKGGCRSFIRADVIASYPKAGGGYSYAWEKRWILNNMVRFS